MLCQYINLVVSSRQHGYTPDIEDTEGIRAIEDKTAENDRKVHSHENHDELLHDHGHEHKQRIHVRYGVSKYRNAIAPGRLRKSTMYFHSFNFS